jgi:Stage II sporulation protein E (SpoIIE)
MARTFAARRLRGLAAVAPLGALLALAPGASAGSLPAVSLPLNVQVHSQQLDPPSVPDVPNPPSPVSNVTGQVTSQVNNTKNQITGQSAPPPSGGGGGGNGNGGNGGNGGGGPNGSGNGPNGSSNGPRSGGGSGDGGGSDRAGGGSGGTSAATRRAARRRAARRAAAGVARVRGDGQSGTAKGAGGPDNGSNVLRPVRDVIKVIPGPVKVLIGVLALLAIVFFLRSFFTGRRARALEKHREELLDDVGLLQKALLPDVPERIGALEATVAYRPAEGPGAGGDFYDVFAMEGDRVAIIVGDVCGHGRQALAVTALMRYTLRAYLTAGGEPRTALQIAARALENEPHAELTTVVLAVYDARAGTLTYACAGHPSPILIGTPAHNPVTVASSPPIGAGLETGLRQTTVALPPGAMACFFTDGLVEARLGEDLLGRERVADIARDLGDGARADQLLDTIAERVDRSADDMAACIVRACDHATQADPQRVEDLELDGAPEDEERARGFLAACGLPADAAERVLKTARGAVGEFGAAILRVHLEGGRGRAEVVPCEQEVRLRATRVGENGGAHASLGSISRISAA